MPGIGDTVGSPGRADTERHKSLCQMKDNSMGDGRTCTREGKREASLKREGHVEPHRIRESCAKGIPDRTHNR